MKDTLYPIFLRALRNGAKSADIANDVTEALNSAIKTINLENANLTRAAGLLNEYLGKDANITLEDLKAFCASRASRTTSPTPDSPKTIASPKSTDDSTIWDFVMSL